MTQYDDIAGEEYKTTVGRANELFRRHFAQVYSVRTWPTTRRGFGDVYFVMKSPNRAHQGE